MAHWNPSYYAQMYGQPPSIPQQRSAPGQQLPPPKPPPPTPTASYPVYRPAPSTASASQENPILQHVHQPPPQAGAYPGAPVPYGHPAISAPGPSQPLRSYGPYPDSSPNSLPQYHTYGSSAPPAAVTPAAEHTPSYYPPPPPVAGSAVSAPSLPQAPSTAYYPPPPPIQGHASFSDPPPPPPANPVANLSSQFSNMRVNDGPHPQTAKAREQPKPAPLIRADGAKNEVLDDCPEWIGIDYPLHWHRIPSVPDFLVCTACHAKHIAHSTLESSFERIEQPEGTLSVCHFWVPRVADMLWPAAVKSGDLTALKNFMTHRLKIHECPGTGGAVPDAGVKWFGPKDAALAGIMVCEACYEDRLLATTFALQFEPLEQREGETWTCDVSNTHLIKALKEFGGDGKSNWANMKGAIIARSHIPSCEGEVVELSSRKWFVSRRPIEQLMVCETCFIDNIALTEFEAEFQPYITPQKQQKPGLASFLGAAVTEPLHCNCDFAIPSLIVAFGAALSRHDYTVFHTAATTILAAIPCTEKGITNGTWYTLPPTSSPTPLADTFKLCPACHAGYTTPTGLSPHFHPVPSPPGATLLCSLHPTAPRFLPTLARLAQALATGVLAPLSTFTTAFAGVPPCARDAPVANGRWWGWGARALFCAECQLTVAAGTALGACIEVCGERVVGEVVCSLYSARMRGLWGECGVGEPGDVARWVGRAEGRSEVFFGVRGQLEYLRGMRRLRVQNAMHQGVLSTMYAGAASIREASGATDGYQYGNGSLGWHSTQDGATAQQLMNNMHSGMAGANQAEDVMKEVQLEALWKSVE